MNWISVEERLPEMDEKVLVLRSNNLPRIDIEWYMKRDHWRSGFYDDGEMDTNVTHWMPLPDPPIAPSSSPHTKETK